MSHVHDRGHATAHATASTIDEPHGQAGGIIAMAMLAVFVLGMLVWSVNFSMSAQNQPVGVQGPTSKPAVSRIAPAEAAKPAAGH
jgi:hypothetical protein